MSIRFRASRLPLALASLLLAGAAFSAQAADYPNQSIRVVVPFPPGGGTDVVARLLVAKVREVTGWTLIVDNRAGAGGNIGMDVVAKSKPDGYTLGLGQTANLAINPAIYAKMPYDASKDFQPIALIAGQPMVLVVNGTSKFQSVADLVAAARAKPGTLNMASAGSGTVGHLTGELFSRQAGIQINHIPYKGAGQAATDLMGDQTDLYFASPQTVMTQLRAGKLRALAVSSTDRLPALPDTPTLAQSGYAGFDTKDWKLLVAPAGVPAEIVETLNAAAMKALALPDTVTQLNAEGSVPLSGSVSETTRYLQTEQKRWPQVARDANLKVD